MPGIRISAAMKAALPEDQRDDLEDYLWNKSGGKCFLCSGQMNRASDTLEADHDDPDAEGGPTDRDNLNLAHASCNQSKQNNPSMDVRPYLKLQTFMRTHGGMVKYGDVLPHFDIKPRPAVVTTTDGRVRLELPDGSVAEAQVYTEQNRDNVFTYAYVELPRNAIFNDNDVQPRNIKLSHLWAIYSDLHRNPLHEAPGCRILARGKTTRLVMFDGQHKTVATWMLDRPTIVAKLYLDLDKDSAVELVNSVQAKIKKLPLSPFELSAKMSDEWRNKLERYQNDVGIDQASEAKFLKWLPVAERTRGKQAFRSALVQNVLDAEDFQLLRYVRLAGAPHAEGAQLTENQIRSKLLERLLQLDALDEKIEDAAALRNRERDNIVRALNAWVEMVFPPVGGGDQSAQAQERLRRMNYQSSLSVIADLIRALFGHVLAISGATGRQLLEKEPSDDQWNAIFQGIRRIVDHPAWTADMDLSDKMRAINDALSKNQDAGRAFGDVGLKLGYVVGADVLPGDVLT